jgi:hypothetical protein
MSPATHAPSELCALTDSLTSSIRWRMRDYEAILRAELEILTEPDATVRPRLLRVAGRPSLES